MPRKFDQRIVSLALGVLDHAAYRARTHRVDTVEVRLALLILTRYVDDRSGLTSFWNGSSLGTGGKLVESPCRQPYYAIAAALREWGWDAPVDRPRDPIL